jgi:thiol-disulfide isomerase/thioredoxin
MTEFNNTPVHFLELDDVKPDGTLIANIGKPIFVMIQGTFCGYCTKSKPDFAKFAVQNPQIFCATVLIDGNDSEKALNKVLSKVIPDYKGVPTFYGITKSGKVVGDKLGRTIADHEKFCGTIME